MDISGVYATVGVVSDSSLNALSNVSVSSLAGGELLVYSATADEWGTTAFFTVGTFITSASASSTYVNKSSIATDLVLNMVTVCAAANLSAGNQGDMLLVSNSVVTTVALTTADGSAIGIGAQIPIQWYGSAQPVIVAASRIVTGKQQS